MVLTGHLDEKEQLQRHQLLHPKVSYDPTPNKIGKGLKLKYSFDVLEGRGIL
jgi:hypothetical protein